MSTARDNIIYEIELIGGGLLIICSGLWLWKRSGLENEVIPVNEWEQGKSECAD